MSNLTELHNLKFSNELANFVENELLPGLILVQMIFGRL